MFSKSKYVKKPFSHALSKNKKRELDFSNSLVNSSDLDKIQTCNLLSRNQVRYSVAPRGRLGVQIYLILTMQQN
jgi:hypothetical protein